MDIADIILFVASNKKICAEWNDLPSKTEFKLISCSYSALDKQFAKTRGESTSLPIYIAHILREVLLGDA